MRGHLLLRSTMLLTQLLIPAAARPLFAGTDVHADRRAAELAYEKEMAREGKDCLEALTTADVNDCAGRARTETTKNFDAFYNALRSVLIDISADDARALALDAAQTTWEKSRQQTCDAVAKLSEGGTVEPRVQTQCIVRLTRSRMRDLHELYVMPLNR